MKRNAVTSSGAKDWKQSFATGIWSCLLLIAVLILSRKTAGAFRDEVSELAALLVALFATGLSLTAFVLFQSARFRNLQNTGRIAAGVVTLVPPMVLGIALAPTDSTVAAGCLAILFLVASGAVLVSGQDVVSRLIGPQAANDKSPSAPITTDEESYAAESAADEETPEISPTIDLPVVAASDNVHQWMTRSADDNGRDSIEGAILVAIAAGQNQATLHVPFSPPFAGHPQISCEVLNDCPVRVKVASAHPYGVRIEIRRSGSAALADSVKVGFHAVGAPLRIDAA